MKKLLAVFPLLFLSLLIPSFAHSSETVLPSTNCLKSINKAYDIDEPSSYGSWYGDNSSNKPKSRKDFISLWQKQVDNGCLGKNPVDIRKVDFQPNSDLCLVTVSESNKLARSVDKNIWTVQKKTNKLYRRITSDPEYVQTNKSLNKLYRLEKKLVATGKMTEEIHTKLEDKKNRLFSRQQQIEHRINQKPANQKILQETNRLYDEITYTEGGLAMVNFVNGCLTSSELDIFAQGKDAAKSNISLANGLLDYFKSWTPNYSTDDGIANEPDKNFKSFERYVKKTIFKDRDGGEKYFSQSKHEMIQKAKKALPNLKIQLRSKAYIKNQGEKGVVYVLDNQRDYQLCFTAITANNSWWTTTINYLYWTRESPSISGGIGIRCDARIWQ